MKLFFANSEQLPVHIVGKCPMAGWPTKNLSEVWDLFCELIDQFQTEYLIRTHAFVMMRNHYHWLCTTEEDAGTFEWFHEAFNFDFLHSFQFQSMIEQGIQPQEPLPQPPKIFKIQNLQQYRNTYAYVYQNPIQACLVHKAEQYPFSTLPYCLGRTPKQLPFMLWDNMNLIYHPKRVLDFVNGFKDHCDQRYWHQQEFSH